jgi:hypothetical protein
MVTTFIGACNDSVPETIYDPTSARRFWQIDTMEKCDWNEINNFDYIALWQSVDENAECPILGVIDEISKIQNEKLRAKYPVEEWVENRCTLTEEPTTQASKAYADFKEYEKFADIPRRTTLTSFGRRLKQVPGIKHGKKTGGVFYNIRLKTQDEDQAAMQEAISDFTRFRSSRG